MFMTSLKCRRYLLSASTTLRTVKEKSLEE